MVLSRAPLSMLLEGIDWRDPTSLSAQLQGASRDVGTKSPEDTNLFLCRFAFRRRADFLHSSKNSKTRFKRTGISRFIFEPQHIQRRGGSNPAISAFQ